MIDSHCHLNFESLSNNLNQLINNAQNNQINTILSINTDPDKFENHYKLISKYKSIFLSYGLHPEHVTKKKNITIDQIIKNSSFEKVIAIGETGLDFFHSTEFTKEQYICFERHIEASILTGLPLIIHQRNSEDEIIDILKSYQKDKNLKVVLHCFTGTNKLKNFCLDNNYFISISGIITFKNASNIRDVIKDLPLSSLLIETDSPFLTPVPHRGKLNEPAYVKFIAQYLAEFFNTTLDDIIYNTDTNFYKLFSKAIRYNNLLK